jgi:hypothetical protein
MILSTCEVVSLGRKVLSSYILHLHSHLHFQIYTSLIIALDGLNIDDKADS